MKLEIDQLESLYTTMVKIRRFDEKTAELFIQGLVKGTAHSYVGEEAVAAAACASLREDDYIVGANQGVVHESLNLSGVWKLPIVYLCENNQYALSTASTRTTAGASIAARAAGYGIPGGRGGG